MSQKTEVREKEKRDRIRKRANQECINELITAVDDWGFSRAKDPPKMHVKGITELSCWRIENLRHLFTDSCPLLFESCPKGLEPSCTTELISLL